MNKSGKGEPAENAIIVIEVERRKQSLMGMWKAHNH